MKKMMKPSINALGNIEVRLDDHLIVVDGESGMLLHQSLAISTQDLFHMLTLAHNYAPEKKDG